MQDYEAQILYARERKTLTQWGKWARENGLLPNCERLNKHKIRQSLAYPFRLTITGFARVQNGEELLNQLNHEFDWENSNEGFVREPENKEVAIYVAQRGDWPQKERHRKKRRFANKVR